MKKFKEDKVYTIKYHTDEETGKMECRTLEDFAGFWAAHRNKEKMVIDNITSVITVTFKRTLKDRLSEDFELMSYKLRKKFERA